ncbi:MAG: transcription antitermination factor NusB [Actinomycetota bacterium]
MTAEPRDLAVQALYEADQRDLSMIEVDLPPKAARLVSGVLQHVAELDHDIDRASQNWRIERMPVVDKAILRLGLYELRYEETPTPVIISEAVRLAKTFSTERSGAFVNGVLATLAERERSGASARNDE